MASITARYNKNGELTSYLIRVFLGRDIHGKQRKPATTTFHVEPRWKPETAYKKAQAFANVYEKQILEGTLSDSRSTFQQYCDYVIALKAERGVKHSTIQRYKSLAERIYEQIGTIRVIDLRAEHLNRCYSALSQCENKRDGGKLSPKTVLEHHRLISTVLECAYKEGLVPINVAQRAEPPKLKQHEVNYYQPETLTAIREALESEPLMWRALVHLLLITGARRGEVLGLRWKKVDCENCKITIDSAVLYSADIGIYESTPKTTRSVRTITVPPETIALLNEWRNAQNMNRFKLGSAYQDTGFIFTQANGSPLHPDSVTSFLNRFSKRHDLPHLNAHAFRHSMASLLYYNGVDSVSVSRRLGHAQVSTTANIYCHVIEKADAENADILAKTFLGKKEA